MNEWMNEWLAGWLAGWINGWKDRQTDAFQFWDHRLHLKESDDNKSESEHVTAKLSKANEEPEQKGSWSDGWMED